VAVPGESPPGCSSEDGVTAEAVDGVLPDDRIGCQHKSGRDGLMLSGLEPLRAGEDGQTVTFSPQLIDPLVREAGSSPGMMREMIHPTPVGSARYHARPSDSWKAYPSLGDFGGVMIPGDRVSSQYSAANRRMASSAVIVGLAYTFKRTVFIDRLGLDGTWHKVCLVATGNPLVGGSTHS
jgi:hypothetical protein